jgi:hypothetical protein
LALSVATYHVVENPIRHLRVSSGRTVGAGVVLVLGTFVILSSVVPAGIAALPKAGVPPAPNTGFLLHQVAEATRITTVSKSIARANYGASYGATDMTGLTPCVAYFTDTRERACELGYPKGRDLMVVYGDSHALMWIPAFEAIAKAEHWRLVVLGKVACPAAPVTVLQDPNIGLPTGPDTECDEWHRWATNWINRHRPTLLVFSEADYYSLPIAKASPMRPFGKAAWARGLHDLFNSFTVSKTKMAFLGDIPMLVDGGPECLAAHPQDAQDCSSPARLSIPSLIQVDRQAALAAHVRYINTIPWFCTQTCTSIIGPYEVYDATGAHVSSIWASYLQNVLGESLEGQF